MDNVENSDNNIEQTDNKNFFSNLFDRTKNFFEENNIGKYYEGFKDSVRHFIEDESGYLRLGPEISNIVNLLKK